MRRVVVSGLGAITPLGASIQHTWRALIAGKSGIVNVPRGERWDELPCRVGGIVPTPLENPSSTGDIDTSNGSGISGNIQKKGREGDGLWRPNDWLEKGDERRMARFTQYAVAAAEMAMADAGWKPERGSIGAEMTGVAVGSGIGNFEEVVNTSVAYDKGVSAALPHIPIPISLLHI
jgi:3-oxoacyl-[acyl-carrier-protein] synthase II